MISVALVADSDSALEAMTRSVSTLTNVTVVRHCHAGAHAVVPATAGAGTLGLVVADVMRERGLDVQRESPRSRTDERRRTVLSEPTASVLPFRDAALRRPINAILERFTGGPQGEAA